MFVEWNMYVGNLQMLPYVDIQSTSHSLSPIICVARFLGTTHPGQVPISALAFIHQVIDEFRMHFVKGSCYLYIHC